MVASEEIERKYLVPNPNSVIRRDSPTRLVQGYLRRSADVELRIRLTGNRHSLAAKLGIGQLIRLEEEFPLEYGELGEALLDIAEATILKDRYSVIGAGGALWDVDVFLGDNEPLAIAEIELTRESVDAFTPPEWCGREVTGMEIFYNSFLAYNPVSTWDLELRRDFGLN